MHAFGSVVQWVRLALGHFYNLLCDLYNLFLLGGYALPMHRRCLGGNVEAMMRWCRHVLQRLADVEDRIHPVQEASGGATLSSTLMEPNTIAFVCALGDSCSGHGAPGMVRFNAALDSWIKQERGCKPLTISAKCRSELAHALNGNNERGAALWGSRSGQAVVKHIFAFLESNSVTIGTDVAAALGLLTLDVSSSCALVIARCRCAGFWRSLCSSRIVCAVGFGNSVQWLRYAIIEAGHAEKIVWCKYILFQSGARGKLCTLLKNNCVANGNRTC